MAKRKNKLSPKEIAEIGRRAIKAHAKESQQIGKEARAIIAREEALAQEQERAATVTADDVWRYENPEAVRATNGLVDGSIHQTMENCACVLALIRSYHCRQSAWEEDERETMGLYLIVDWVHDALEKQRDALNPTPRDAASIGETL